MKKYILFAISGIISAFLTSCLGVDITDRVEKETGFYKTEDQALSAIYSSYSVLTEFAYCKTNWSLILPAYEDAMFITGATVPATVSNNTHSSASAPCVNFWGTIYSGINDVNDIIARIPSIEFTNQNDKNRILAEAHFLRALFHYDLVRLFGGENGIPILTEPTTGISNAYIKQSPKELVYKQIIEDFESAAGKNDDGTTYLPKFNDSGYVVGRATDGAAHAFLSEVYLTLGRWQDAINEADIVIGQGCYKLMDDYAQLWNVEQESASLSENIFSVPFFRDTNALSDNSLGSNMAYLFCPAGRIVGGENVSGNPYGKGSGTQKVQKWFIKFFQDDVDHLGYSDPSKDASKIEANLSYKDYRIETSFWRAYQQVSNAGVLGDIITCYPAAGGKKQENWGYIKKYIDPQGVDNRTNENDMPRIRLSDMYLIKAEAYNELGNYTEACNAIDKVRERARKANGSERSYPKYISLDKTDNIGRTLTQQQFRWLVFMERGLEFAGECKRWFDLVRMKYDDSMLMYDYMENVYLPKISASDINKQGVMADRKKYFPIPQNEVFLNSGVVQNTGY